jgi:hypothetical protein
MSISKLGEFLQDLNAELKMLDVEDGVRTPDESTPRAKFTPRSPEIVAMEAFLKCNPDDSQVKPNDDIINLKGNHDQSLTLGFQVVVQIALSVFEELCVE